MLRRRLGKIGRFCLALGLLWSMLYAGKALAWLVPIGISESIWGLLLLFSGLVCGVVKLDWVLPASRPLLCYMTLFFLPICAGIVEQTDVLLTHIQALVVANFLSAVLSLVVIGYFAQWLFSRSVKRERSR